MANIGQGVVAVACSGGRDSLALLHATLRSAGDLGLSVAALHVHHGLQAQADDWLRHLQALAVRWRRRGWPVTLHWQRLAGQPAAGQSVEAWARLGRYAALAAMARRAGAGIVLLGHHRRDQAETLLLQALRGAGPAGLAAMPLTAERDGLVWARPWLDQPRAVIEAYVRRHRLRPLEDPSNQDPALARNRLRLQVWPALEAAFSGAEAALAGAARRAHEADTALAELAAMDLTGLVDGQGCLLASGWAALSPARRTNALRAWWLQVTGRRLPDAAVQRLREQWPVRSAAASLRWPVGQGQELSLYRGRLSASTAPVATAAPPPGVQELNLAASALTSVPTWAGRFELGPGPGLALADLQCAQLRPRQGGEQFQLAPRSQPRSLKKQYQARAVPARQRDGPLVWAGQRLLYVPGLGIDARALAPPGQAQRGLRWLPDMPIPSGL